MSEPFLSEIKIVSFNFAPKGWALCNGQLLPINQNQALFALLGTTYGGNGQTTFALPNLRGQVPIHFGGSYQLGEKGGSTSVTINTQSMATHTHTLRGQTEVVPPDDNAQNPSGRTLAGAQTLLQGGTIVGVQIYGQPASLTPLNAQAVSNVGGSQPHNNMMPYLTLNFIIALQGIFPSRN
jgi:microcystin-dependent protein